MQITIELPDEIATALAGANGSAGPNSVPRAVLEAIALEGYRSEALTHAQVGRLLGIDYRFDVDAFLKEHGADLHYGLEDLERDSETLRRLGF